MKKREVSITTKLDELKTEGNQLRMELINGAYYIGFEPSKERLTIEELYNEALRFLTNVTRI